MQVVHMLHQEEEEDKQLVVATSCYKEPLIERCRSELEKSKLITKFSTTFLQCICICIPRLN